MFEFECKYVNLSLNENMNILLGAQIANSNTHIELKIMTRLSCTSVKGGIFTPILLDSLPLCEVDIYEVSHVGRVKRLLVLPVLVFEKLEE